MTVRVKVEVYSRTTYSSRDWVWTSRSFFHEFFCTSRIVVRLIFRGMKNV